MEEESPTDATTSPLTTVKHLSNSRPLNLEAVCLFVWPFFISCFSLVPPTKGALQMPDRIVLPFSFDLVQLILVHSFQRHSQCHILYQAVLALSINWQRTIPTSG